MNKVTRDRMFLRLHRFSPVFIIPQAPYSFPYLSAIDRIFNTSLITKYEVIRLFSCLVGWLVCCLVGWLLVGWLVGWLVDWLVG